MVKEKISLVKTVFKEFFQERSFLYGAALAYYALLAIVPTLYLAVTFYGQIVGHDTMVEIISTFLNEQVGIRNPEALLSFLDEVDLSERNTVMTVFGIIALMFSTTAIISSLRKSINEFYDLEKWKVGTRRRIVRGLLFRLLSMLFVLGVTTLIVVVYFAETVIFSMGNDVFNNTGWVGEAGLVILRNGMLLLVNWVILFFIFQFLHDGKVHWRRSLEGALLTSVMLYIGQLVIQFYLRHYFFAASGGVAGTPLILLVWVYYSSQIIFLGAKFIAVRSRMKGRQIVLRD